MALPATHIRFAVTIADRLAVGDMAAYLSGTIYPDSRWLTGVDREQTHAHRFNNPAFPSDAFTLGWHVHCACDLIQADLHERILAGLADLDAEARWIRCAAAKVVQDMRDSQRIDLDSRMRLLRHANAPNGESRDRVFEYLQRVRRTYLGEHTATWALYSHLWQAINLSPSRIAAIEKQVRDMQKIGFLKQRIHDCFDGMVKRWQADWAVPVFNGRSEDG